VLGEIFGVTDRVGAGLLDISRDNFRQKLARARRDLSNFMQGKYGPATISLATIGIDRRPPRGRSEVPRQA
jgi:hypothetical protein